MNCTRVTVCEETMTIKSVIPMFGVDICNEEPVVGIFMIEKSEPLGRVIDIQSEVVTKEKTP